MLSTFARNTLHSCSFLRSNIYHQDPFFCDHKRMMRFGRGLSSRVLHQMLVCMPMPHRFYATCRRHFCRASISTSPHHSLFFGARKIVWRSHLGFFWSSWLSSPDSFIYQTCDIPNCHDTCAALSIYQTSVWYRYGHRFPIQCSLNSL